MADLESYIITFNCGREPVDTDFFAAHLLDGLKSRDVPLDLIVLCLQEVAPIAYSFLSAAMMASYTQRYEAAVHLALHNKYGRDIANKFLPMELRNVGMTAIMLFARRDLLGRIERVDTAGVGTGLWNMGNKGAAGIRLWLDAEGDDGIVPITLVSAHLAPMESAWERRNADWRSICEGLVFTKDSSYARSRLRSSEEQPLLSKDGEEQQIDAEQSMFSPAASLFFAGDLNYRTSNVKPEPQAHKEWPAPDDPGDFSAMLEQDQLSRERHKKKTLHLMDEAHITFAPTYKYSSKAQQEARKLETSSKTSSSLWAEHRKPSWCDRVLFLEESQPKINSYTALPIQPTSDHRPVALSVSIPVKHVSAALTPPFGIDKAWHSRRAAARRLEVLVGVGAYLTLTYEGNAMLVGSLVAIIGGALAIRAMG